MLFADLLSLHLVTYLMFFILVAIEVLSQFLIASIIRSELYVYICRSSGPFYLSSGQRRSEQTFERQLCCVKLFLVVLCEIAGKKCIISEAYIPNTKYFIYL